MMNLFSIRLLKLIWGLFLYALGIVVTINAHIGYLPWDVFHVGLAQTTGMSIGVASIVVGVIIGILAVLLREKLGLGTVLNMVLIGVFMDGILNLHVIPTASNFVIGSFMMILGLFIIAFGSYFYIGSAFGAGPRDSLMVALTRITKLPIGVCRAIIELLAALVGWQLGGMLGAGTILSAFAIGFCVQIIFKALKFRPTTIQHESLDQTFKIGLRREKEQY